MFRLGERVAYVITSSLVIVKGSLCSYSSTSCLRLQKHIVSDFRWLRFIVETLFSHILFSLMYRVQKKEGEPGKYQLQFVKLSQNRLQINKNLKSDGGKSLTEKREPGSRKNYRTVMKGVLNMTRTKRETGRRGKQPRLQYIDWRFLYLLTMFED